MLKSVSETLLHRGVSALALAIYGTFKIQFFSRLLGRRFVTHNVYDYRLLLDTKTEEFREPFCCLAKENSGDS